MGWCRRCFAAVIVLLTTAAASAQTKLLVDPGLTVGAGATIATAAGAALARGEERFVPVRLFAEHGVTRRAADIAYRLLRVTLFDAPQEQLLMVANHELAGHGGRLRERFDGPITYRLDAPPPYGRGGGATYFEFDREPSIHELLAVSAGGMEANHVAADLVADAAVTRRRLGMRSGVRYLAMRLDATAYIRGTSDAAEEPGHDVSDFLGTYNELARAAGTPRLEARTLRREALLSYADPMLVYAGVAIGRFIATGNERAAVRMLRIGPLRYLPSLRYRLTPFGTEWAIANAIAGGGRTLRIDVRAGRSPGRSPWGAGVRAYDIAAVRAWHLSVSGDTWQQPRLALNAADPIDIDVRWGGAVRVRAARSLASVPGGTLDLVIDAGAKTNGFTPGEPLAGGALLRVGMALPLER